MDVAHTEELGENRRQLLAVWTLEPLRCPRRNRLHQLDGDGVNHRPLLGLEGGCFPSQPLQLGPGHRCEPCLQYFCQGTHACRDGKQGTTAKSGRILNYSTGATYAVTDFRRPCPGRIFMVNSGLATTLTIRRQIS